MSEPAADERTREPPAELPPAPPVDEPTPPPEQPPPPEPGEPDDLTGPEPEPDDEPPVFDVDAFVRSLPEGVCLCPHCLGMGAIVEEPPFDPYVHLCATCRGFGRVRTGALVGGEGERGCPDCGGRGWQPNEPGEPPATPARPEQFTATEPPRDHLGRTPDDPEFDWARVVSLPVAGEQLPAVEPAPIS